MTAVSPHQQRAPFDLWHDALAGHPDDEDARRTRYHDLMVEHGYIIPRQSGDDANACCIEVGCHATEAAN